jgi:demethylmenaquinone methyltransferase/2-methoxy-6-polyprenyl-1,4-benzoquinol methylase
LVDLRVIEPVQRVVLPTGVPGTTKSERVRAMFARIVPRYDLTNRVMSLGMDLAWRSEAAKLALPTGGIALDIGTGTGDLALELARAGACKVVAVDFVPSMLAVARQKIAELDRPDAIALAGADAMALPFPTATFDCVVSAFVLRNVADLRGALLEMARVLRPRGRLVCLELTHPTGAVRPVLSFYFGRVVPIVGALLTGEPDAYSYLPASLGPLPSASELAQIIRETGLRDVSFRRLGFGSVAVHRGVRA